MKRSAWGAMVVILAAAAPSRAADRPSVTGEGRAGQFQVAVSVQPQADGRPAGSLQVVQYAASGAPVLSCTYDRFTGLKALGHRAGFVAAGMCTGGTGAGWAVTSRVLVADGGPAGPGPGPDTLSITPVGSAGPAVREGRLDAGDLSVEADSRAAAEERQLQALRRLRQATAPLPVDVRLVDGFPRQVIARVPAPGPDAIARARDHLDRYRDLYRLNDPDLWLGVRRAGGEPGAPGDVVVFYQTYKGLAIHNAELAVVTRGETLYGTLGALLTDVHLDTTPELPAAAAEEAARTATGRPDAATMGQTLLMVFDRSLLEDAASAPRLAWRVTVGGGDPRRLFVDAGTGEVLSNVALSANDYELDIESAEWDGNADDSACFWGTDDVGMGDEDGVYPDFQNDAQANAVFAFAKPTYYFFWNKFGRDSYDNDGNEIEVYVHTTYQNNAQYKKCWNGEEVFEFSDNFIVDDVMTHEFTHGVEAYRSGLTSGGFSGALKESYSDIFAALQEGDWIQGDDMAPQFRRSLSNPPAFDQCSGPGADPDRWSERCTSPKDEGSVHSNAGIPNKAAFLLADGGTHPDTSVTVQGVGKGASSHLHYWAMWLLPGGADFFDARAASILAAQLLGWPDYALCSVKNAWGAVEIGNPDKNCDGVPDLANDADDDTVLDNVDNCPHFPNTLQDNLDGDDLGNACDSDDDGDNVNDDIPPPLGDNCPGIPNPDQIDDNHNFIGAACDPLEDGDLDDDGVPDVDDNCPLDHNPGRGLNHHQADSDQDGEGDACDPDMDEDGMSNDNDNCVTVPNSDQANTDGDVLGDACDICVEDPDSHVTYGYFTNEATGETVIFPQAPDADGDGTPDACDDDGFGSAALTIDGQAFRPSRGPRLDGRARHVTLKGQPGSSVSIPVPICLGECAQAPPAGQCVSFAFPGLGKDVAAAVVDDGGVSAAKVPRRGDQRLGRLQPRGGRRYNLQFTLSPRSGGVEEFDLVAGTCVVGDRGQH